MCAVAVAVAVAAVQQLLLWWLSQAGVQTDQQSPTAGDAALGPVTAVSLASRSPAPAGQRAQTDQTWPCPVAMHVVAAAAAVAAADRVASAAPECRCSARGPRKRCHLPAGTPCGSQQGATKDEPVTSSKPHSKSSNYT